MLLPDRVLIATLASLLALNALPACSAEQDTTSMGPRGLNGSGTGAPGSVPPGSGATAGRTSGGVAGASTTDPFGNSTTGVPVELPPGAGPATDECLEATVAFVVDGSGSMCAPFGASTRWQELRTALLAPDMGLIYRLQAQAKFGLVLYDGSIDIALVGMATGGTPSPDCAGASSAGRLMAMDCMQLVNVDPSLYNADAIAQAFPMRELGGSTPTDRAMNQTIDGLIAAQAGVNLALFPQFIILATDGQPNDICVGGAGGDGTLQQQNVILAADRAAAANIKTFVISLAGDDVALQAHLDEVARHGNPTDPAAHTFTPANPEELVSALATVLGNALGCNVL